MGDDGAIACCVSPMMVGKQMQFFGASANLANCFLYAVNGGRDEVSGEQAIVGSGASCSAISKYAYERVDFVRLTGEQQMDVINRAFHGAPS
jgi:pyruvate-formate lyase